MLQAVPVSSCLISLPLTDPIVRLAAAGRPIILSEALVWAAVLAIAEPLGYEVMGLDLDSDGIKPAAVEKACLELEARGE